MATQESAAEDLKRLGYAIDAAVSSHTRRFAGSMNGAARGFKTLDSWYAIQAVTTSRKSSFARARFRPTHFRFRTPAPSRSP